MLLLLKCLEKEKGFDIIEKTMKGKIERRESFSIWRSYQKR